MKLYETGSALDAIRREGKKIQLRFQEGSGAWWEDVGPDTKFADFDEAIGWRVKPEPREPRRVWLCKADISGENGWPCRVRARNGELIGSDSFIEFIEVLKP